MTCTIQTESQCMVSSPFELRRNVSITEFTKRKRSKRISAAVRGLEPQRLGSAAAAARRADRRAQHIGLVYVRRAQLHSPAEAHPLQPT